MTFSTSPCGGCMSRTSPSFAAASSSFSTPSARHMRRSEPNWLIRSGWCEPFGFSNSSAGPPALTTRSVISVISRSGSTSAEMRRSSPWRSRSAIHSRRCRGDATARSVYFQGIRDGLVEAERCRCHARIRRHRQLSALRRAVIRVDGFPERLSGSNEPTRASVVPALECHGGQALRQPAARRHRHAALAIREEERHIVVSGCWRMQGVLQHLTRSARPGRVRADSDSGRGNVQALDRHRSGMGTRAHAGAHGGERRRGPGIAEGRVEPMLQADWPVRVRHRPSAARLRHTARHDLDCRGATACYGSNPAHRLAVLEPWRARGLGHRLLARRRPVPLQRRRARGFDLVGFDPRGIIRSTAFRCFGNPKQWEPFFTPFPFPYTPAEEALWITADRYLDAACDQRGGTIGDHMSTANVARDLDLLRQAVDDEKLTYAGYSYGSFLGTTYASLFPDKSVPSSSTASSPRSRGRRAHRDSKGSRSRPGSAATPGRWRP